MKREVKPTKVEKQIATEMQAPENKPEALQKMGIFSSLLNQPTMDAAQLFGGGTTIWINAMQERNELFPEGGDFSRPFFIIRAWQFTSKTATQKDRIGMKLALSDENVYHVSLSYPFKIDKDSGELVAIYPDRQIVIDHFEFSSTPIGLMQFQKVDRGQNNPYWRLIYADEGTMELANVKLKPDADDANAGYMP